VIPNVTAHKKATSNRRTNARSAKSAQDLRAQVGQLLIIGFDGTEMSPALRSLLARIQPAGVILFARNISSAQQTHRLLKDCQAAVDVPLFRCVDLEGGLVDRFRNVLGSAPSPADAFATGHRKLFRKHGRILGENCRALGFNVDFAPAVDLAFEASRPVMRSRAVSEDPQAVINYAREFLAGLREADVLGSGKHFPGLGEGKLDSHHDLPVIHKSWKALWEQDLVPYRVLKQQFTFVMVSHAAYPEVTGEPTPASLSRKWITDILRKKIGFRGLIASDDLEMGGVLSAGPIEQASVEHVRAGGDLCLLCHLEDGIVRSYEQLIREAESDRRFAQRVADSSRRTLAFKKRQRDLAQLLAAPTDAKTARLRRQLWEFAEELRLATIVRQETA
jgi:beta-N-acetylhexosaminidase